MLSPWVFARLGILFVIQTPIESMTWRNNYWVRGITRLILEKNLRMISNIAKKSIKVIPPREMELLLHVDHMITWPSSISAPLLMGYRNTRIRPKIIEQPVTTKSKRSTKENKPKHSQLTKKA